MAVTGLVFLGALILSMPIVFSLGAAGVHGVKNPSNGSVRP